MHLQSIPIILITLTLTLFACGNDTSTSPENSTLDGGNEPNPEQVDASPISEGCSFENCMGCCSGTECIYTGPDACGQGGSACETCTGAESCVAGTCVEPAACDDCEGCCFEGSQCLTGDWQGACGDNGDACIACPSGQGCDDGVCTEIICDASNCAGCCTANGDCISNEQQDTSSCGKSGAACSVCDLDATSCTQGTCVAEQACLDFCDNGCCTAQGQCVPFSAQDADTCGSATCSPCGDELSCLEGACTANPVWIVKVESAILTPSDTEGEKWDQALFTDPLPDAYVTGALGGDTLIDWTTATIDNTLTPVWAEEKDSYLQTALLAEGFHFNVRDADGLGVFDAMGSCTVNIDMGDLLSGGMLIPECGTLVTSLRISFLQQ